MTRRRTTPTPDDPEDLAHQVADHLLEAQRENRRRLWRRLGYLLMLLGALGGLITALAVIWDWVG
jgi:hypothetical protein